MNYKMIEVSRLGRFVNGDWYEFITEEKWINGFGTTWAKGRTRPKFYTIRKNNKDILHTSLHQTFNKYKRDILGK